MPNPKKYIPLSATPEYPRNIGKCGQILPNRLQCWRSGDVQVEEQVPREPTEKDPSTTYIAVYQLCNAHAIIQQKADEAATKAEAAATASQHPAEAGQQPVAGETNTPPAVATPTGAGTTAAPAGSFHEQMLSTLGGSPQGAMPQGEDSPHNQ